eukprot:6676930-Ditylum_brightwellii.AAC.1
MAMDHAAWLFNRIPKMESTYNPLEYGHMTKYLIHVIPGTHHHMYWIQNYKNQELKYPNEIKEQELSLMAIPQQYPAIQIK